MNETLTQQGLPPIGAEKCKTKWETLKRRYKNLKDSQKSSGSAPITWSFYDVIMKTSHFFHTFQNFQKYFT